MRTGSIRTAEISLPAIRHNVRRIRELTGGAVIAVMKANGYGHGGLVAARAAIEAGAELIGVTDLEEALALRSSGIDAPILCWLHGIRADFDAAVAGGIEIGISHPLQLEAVAAAAERSGRVATVQFKIDTGLSRNGAGPDEWAELFARGADLERRGSVRVRGIFSHLANAGDENDRAQAARFDTAIEMLRQAGSDPELLHLAASAATFTSPHLHYNTVRVGITVFGLSPFADRSSADLGLIPAMTLKSEVVALRPIQVGTGVSYGYNHVAQGDTTLALVPMGYADGMPRALNGAGATVAIAGQHCPIVGRIGMDQCIVDLGNLARKVRVGDPVVLFGDPATGVPPVEVWAELMRTINYEIVVGIGPRVVRVPVDEDSHPVGEHLGVPPQGSPTASAGSGFARVVDTSQQLVARDPEETHALGVRLGRQLRAGDLVILTGPLGAGKTTLTRGIGEGLEVRGPVTSPTFVLARTHPALGDGPPLVHVDAYRLADATELDDLDIDFEHSVVIAEWGAGMIDGRDSWLEVVIDRPTGGLASGAEDAPDDTWSETLTEPRVITLLGHGPRWAGVSVS